MRSLLAPVLVGRGVEIARLDKVAERAIAGQGEMVAVVGEAGVGKTALCRHLIGAQVEARAVAAHAPPGQERPLHLIGELVLSAIAAGAVADHHGLDDFRATLHQVVPSLIGEEGGRLQADVEPFSPAVGEAVLRLLGTIPAPVVAIVEDLHWADPDSLVALEYMAGALSGRPISVLVTLRPANSGAMAVVRRLIQARKVEELKIVPLDRAGTKRMVQVCLGSEDVPADLVAMLADAAQGVPYLIEELLWSLSDAGRLRVKDGGWSYETDSGSLPVPASVAADIAERVARLPVEARDVVITAALIGTQIDPDLLGIAVQLPPDVIDEALRAGISLQLIEESDRPSRVRFRHALTCEAVVDAADALARRRFAAGALARLSRAHGDSDEELLETMVRLAQLAGDDRLVTRLALRAGRRALERGVLGSALRYLDVAVAAPAADYESMLAGREALVQALALTGDNIRTQEQGAELVHQLREAVDGEERIEAVRLAMARAASASGRWTDARAVLDTIGQPDDQPRRSRIAAFSALVWLELGRHDAAEAAARSVIDEPRAEAKAVCEALEVLGRIARNVDLDEAADQFERGIVTAERAGLTLWRARAHHELATIAQLRDYDVDELKAARSSAVEAGSQSLIASVDYHLSAVYGVCFESELALEAARRCLERSRRIGSRSREAFAWILIGQAHASAGHTAQAEAAAHEALSLEPDDYEIRGLAWGACRGLAALLEDDRASAVAHFGRAMSALRRLPTVTPVPPWYVWPLLSAVEGIDARVAISEADRGELHVSRGLDALWHLARAVDEGRRGDHARADELAAHADAIFESVPRFAGYKHLGRRLAAEAAIEDGWGDPALWLTAAGRWFSERGLHRPAASCRSLLRRAGVPQRRIRGFTPVPEALAEMGVTGREVDVLCHLAEGLTNKAIAERLFISPRTVKSHVEHLLAKTVLESRVQLASLAISHGLTDRK